MATVSMDIPKQTVEVELEVQLEVELEVPAGQGGAGP